MFLIWKTNYFQLWFLYKSDLRISSPTGKQREITVVNRAWSTTCTYGYSPFKGGGVCKK